MSGGVTMPSAAESTKYSPLTEASADHWGRFALFESAVCFLLVMAVFAAVLIKHERRRGQPPDVAAIIVSLLAVGALFCLIVLSSMLTGSLAGWGVGKFMQLPPETRTSFGLAVALALFIIRQHWRIVYGFAEIGVGIGALWLGSRGNTSTTWLAAMVTSFGAVYIVVRGFTNLDEGLPRSARIVADRIVPGFFRPPEP